MSNTGCPHNVYNYKASNNSHSKSKSLLPDKEPADIQYEPIF